MRKKRVRSEIKNSKVRAKLKIIKNCIFYLIVAVLLLSSVYLISMEANGKQAEVFGYKFYVVLTGSMEPDISPGDMVIVKSIDTDSIRIGDIITFTDKEGKNITTHRVVDIEIKSGDTLFTTKGDANNVEDENKVSEGQVLGKLNKNIKGFGKVIEFFKENIVIIGLSVLFIFIMIFIVFLIFRKMDKDAEMRKRRERLRNALKEK